MSPAPSAAAPSPPSPLLPAPPLPSRVLKAIHDQQDASERLICWVQLAMVTLFGALYLVAPKTLPEDA